MSNNIILIGFMAVGKGRTARELAAQTGRFAVDTDDLIESFAKKKIRKIFNLCGEATFRQMEAAAADWLEKNVSNTIVSTGGGFFMVGNLQRLGTVIYLHAGIEAIYTAISEHPNSTKKMKKRPLLQDLGRARQLYYKRLPLYRRAADYEIDVEGKSSAEVAENIVQVLESQKST